MAVDPNHSPIFGDYVPSNPPRPVRTAYLLLLANVVVEIGYRALLAEHFDDGVLAFVLFMLMLLAFAVGVRAGREWARLGAAFWAFTEVAERSYDHLARNLNEQTPNPVVAAQQASAALAAGLSRAGLSPQRWGSVNRSGGVVASHGTGARRTVRVVLGPGERLVVTRR